MRMNYGVALYQNNGATLDDVREAMTTLEDDGTDRAARARWRASDHSVDLQMHGETRKRRSRPAQRGTVTLRSGQRVRMVKFNQPPRRHACTARRARPRGDGRKSSRNTCIGLILRIIRALLPLRL